MLPLLQAGTNWIAATLGMRYPGSTLAHFDFELYRNVNASCSALPGRPKQCLRVNPQPQTLIPVSGRKLTEELGFHVYCSLAWCCP